MAQDILCAAEWDRHVTILLLNLLLRVSRRGIICYGAAHDDDIIVWSPVYDSIKHIGSTDDRDKVKTYGRNKTDRPRDKCDSGSTQGSHACYGIAHLARRMVSDETHRVDGFSCRTCCDKDPPATHVLLTSHSEHDMLEQDIL